MVLLASAKFTANLTQHFKNKCYPKIKGLLWMGDKTNLSWTNDSQKKTYNPQQNCILSQNIKNPTKLCVFHPGLGLKYVFGIYHIFCMLLQDSDSKMMKNQAKNKYICCYPVEGLDLLNLGYYLFMILLLFNTLFYPNWW